MFAQIYEVHLPIEEELESEDPGMRAIARYVMLAKKHREFRATSPPRGDFTDWETWWADEKKLDRDTFEAWKEVYNVLDGLDDWIYKVSQNIIGEFYVRTVQEAVEGLARFNTNKKGELITDEKFLTKWKERNLSQIRHYCIPIKLGSKGFTMLLGG